MADTWKVIAQPEASGQDASGNFTRGRNVTYQLADGTVGTVFVPRTAMDPDYVRGLINDDVARVTAIRGLTSGS